MPRRSKWMHLVAGVVAGVTFGIFLKLCLRPSSRTSIESCPEAARSYSAPDPLTLIDMRPEETVENSNRTLVFVGVMTAQQYLDTRAKAVYETWGQDLPGRIAFFSSEVSRAPGLPLVALRNVDDSYPPQKKSFLMLLYMYEKYGDRFEWFMRADDDVYVRGDKLGEFLRSVDSRKPQFIGQAGRGTTAERDALALDYNENFCMGGPGVLLSRETLRRVAPHVKYCLKHLYTTHEDVELGRCVAKFAGVSCTWSYDILCTLSFLANGSYQKIIGKNIDTYMSQSSASRCIKLIVNALNHPTIVRKYMKFPQTATERQDLKRRFFQCFKIPGVIGCVDGTLVSMVRPKENEERYYCRKGYHARNVLIINDCDLNILHVDATFGGATHDNFIFNNSVIKIYLEQLYNTGETAYLLGDSGYAQRPYIMTPCNTPEEGTPEEYYNKLHSSARNSVERTIGVLKGRFRCLLVHRVLHYDPQMVSKIVIACCVLHNICNRAGLPFPALPHHLQQEEQRVLQILQRRQIRPTVADDLDVGRHCRQQLINRLWRARR